MRKVFGTCALLAAALGLGCGGDASGDEPHECDAQLTYASFGREFVGEYCASCHGGDVSAGARQGAPEAVVFDTAVQVRAIAGKLEEQVVVLEAMPFGSASKKPSDAQRARFGDWLRCGAPE